MTETFRLIRVFLASPGDLPEERRLAKNAVDEINKQIAPRLGFRVDLMAWEETLPGSGRPQDIINKELDTCELFIGMMWKKWGTPPAKRSIYSSGFEEEFERSSLRCKETGKPEMATFFKEIDPEFLKDPGEDLKKVIEFRDRLDSEKIIFYKKFKDAYELQRYVREKIIQYLIDLEKSIVENQEEERAKSKKPIEDSDKTKNQESIKSPFSAEGHSFLKNFLEKTEAEDSAENITPLEMARFRLLSGVITKPGNDELLLGVHDANIIYSNRHIKYGLREISRLIHCGLKHIKHENVPLWHWYKIYKKYVRDGVLAFASFAYSDEDVSIGALEVMKLIGTKIPDDGEIPDRNIFIKSWLSEKRSDNIKASALRYLKHHGNKEDLTLIKLELDQSRSLTTKISLEAMLNILLHHDPEKVLKATFAHQFEAIDELLLEEILSIQKDLDEETLRLGLQHRNRRIRLYSFKNLESRKEIKADDIQELKNDSFALLRKAIVDYMLLSKESLDDNEVRKILVKPQKKGGVGGIFRSYETDEEGQECYDEYLLSKYSKMNEHQLLEKVAEDSVFNVVPFIALCIRYFKNHAEQLRKNVDDQFIEHFEKYIEREKTMGLSDESIKKTRDLEDFLRRKLTRKGLDILCQKGNPKDLNRIRNNIRAGYTNGSVKEIQYMKKWGEWEDIPFIIKAEKDHASRSSLMSFSIDYHWYRFIAEAIYSIGKGRLEDLLKIEMPELIFVELVKICPLSVFSEISDETLLQLFNNKNDKVRKFTALKSIQSIKKSRLISLLSRYNGKEEYRYYNVIFWLDFGVSMSKKETNMAINMIYVDQ